MKPFVARHAARLRLPQITGAAQRLRDFVRDLRALSRPEGGATDPQPPHPSDLRVASWNLHKCVGADGRFDPHRSAAVIAELGADILALQEVDKRFGRRDGLLDLAAVRRTTGLKLVPVSDAPAGHGWHGNALLLREDLTARVQRIRLPGAEPRGALVAEVDLPQGPLRVIAAHFGLLRRCRTRQGHAILRLLAEGEDMPTVMLGDLNEWNHGPRSSLRVLEPVFGAANPTPASFPAAVPVLALDRILGRPEGLVSGVCAYASPLARIASDHLPLIARLRLDAAAGRAASG
jgi:endonuclease/exonuclease/phosphatase family metal-dependent hydrolase